MSTRDTGNNPKKEDLDKDASHRNEDEIVDDDSQLQFFGPGARRHPQGGGQRSQRNPGERSNVGRQGLPRGYPGGRDYTQRRPADTRQDLANDRRVDNRGRVFRPRSTQRDQPTETNSDYRGEFRNRGGDRNEGRYNTPHAYDRRPGRTDNERVQRGEYRPEARANSHHANRGNNRTAPRGYSHASEPIALLRMLIAFQYASRSLALEAIREGTVSINGEVVTNPGTFLRIDRDEVQVNGLTVEKKTVRPIFVVYRKPSGVCSSREMGQRSLYQVIHNRPSWFGPTGFLPKSVAGLVLITNDRSHGNPSITPLTQLPSTFSVKVNKVLRKTDITKIEKIFTRLIEEDGIAPDLEITSKNKRSSWLKLRMHHKNLAKMFTALKQAGIEPIRTERIGIGPIQNDGLCMGAWYQLTPDEVKGLETYSQDVNTQDSSTINKIWQGITSRFTREAE